MITNRWNEKRTANQFAKEAVLDWGIGAELWEEKLGWSQREKMTDREVEMINAAVDKQIDRVRKLLGV